MGIRHAFCSQVHYTHGHRGLLSVAVTQPEPQIGRIKAIRPRRALLPVSAKAHPRSDPQAWSCWHSARLCSAAIVLSVRALWLQLCAVRVQAFSV